MGSPTKSHSNANKHGGHSSRSASRARNDAPTVNGVENGKHPHAQTRTPEPRIDEQNANANSNTPSTPGVLLPFDWEDFQARYEKALRDADEHEKSVLQEVERLSRYFQAWASAASAHDDERAVKRLQTRQRHVNLSEEKMSQKQQHYEEVVRAFESALALLRSR